MAEILSIKERIERLYVRIVQDITGINRVFRWDGRGYRDPDTGLDVDDKGQALSMENLDAAVIAGDETADEGGMGNTGTTIKRLQVQVHLKIVQDDTDRETTSQIHNRWLRLIEIAVATNHDMTEPEGVGNEQTLATDTRVTDTMQIETEPGQRECITIIGFETQYEHDRTNPATGAGITEYTTED
jgi:hypothetical protein